MRLSLKQTRLFEDWVRRKVEHPSCHVCQGNQWKIGDILMPDSTGVLDEITSREPAMIQLICRNCAHVLLFDVRTVEGWDQVTPHDSSHSAIM